MRFHDAAAAAGGTRLRTGGLALQRACACGTHGPGECESCRKNGGAPQRRERATAGPALRTAPRIQRQPLSAAPAMAPAAAPAMAPASPAAPQAAPAAQTEAPAAPAPGVEGETAQPAPGSTMLVEDGVAEVAPGQMRKTDFLDQLHASVCAGAEAALAGTGRSTDGCPYLAYWFDYYRGQSSGHVESALHRYAPETRGARSAADYIPLVATRVQQGVEHWARTGEVVGVPQDAPAAAGAPAATPGGAGEAVQRKEGSGGARATDAPAAVQARLGEGAPLEGGVRGRMERAFGQSFAHVRTHTDANAGRVSREQDARALTVGRHIAFGSGEYRPGTVVGDALIAHELAHTVQQRGADAGPAAAPGVRDDRYQALESDADRSAVGAVQAMLGGSRESGRRSLGDFLPTLKSGLRLQRCDLFGTRQEEKLEPVEQPVQTKEEPAQKDPAQKEPADVATPAQAADAGADAAPAVSEADRQKPCTSAVAADKVILSHTVSPQLIEKPGDTVTFTAKFACMVRGSGYHKMVDAANNEFGRTTFSAARNELTHTWDGKKLFKDVGTYLVDDGHYRHRIEPFKYAYKNSKDVMTAAESDSPTVEVKARPYTGGGTDHVHYSAANVEAVAKAIETEMGGENDAAKRAVAWAIRNQMIRMNTGDAATAMTSFRVRSGKAASEASRTMATEILKRPMSEDTTSGAIKWFSPNAQPKEGETCKGEGCGGGLDTFTDTAGNKRSVHTPGFHKQMTYVNIGGIDEWRVRFYKL